jgi:hypothetical protein
MIETVKKLSKEEKRAAWIAMGPAIIEKPLRYIHSVRGWGSLSGEAARKAAFRGDGKTVNSIAREVYAN